MRDSAQLRRGTAIPALAALLAALASAFLTIAMLQPLILVAWTNDQPIPITAAGLIGYLADVAKSAANQAGAHQWLTAPGTSIDHVFVSLKVALSQNDLNQRVSLLSMATGGSVVLAFITAFMTTWRLSPPRDRRKHVSGRRLITGPGVRRFFRRAERHAIRVTGAGISLCRGLVMAAQRETRHIMLMGATGAGKTVIIRFLLRQIFRRGDRMIVVDPKGDYTATIPGDFVLIAPQDRRSAVWHVAGDVLSTQDARELAACLVPASKDPIWGAGAREILTGIIVALQVNQPAEWSWDALRAMAFAPIPKLRGVLHDFYPEAEEYLELDQQGAPTKIAISFMITMRACIAGTVLPLAKAWGATDGRRKFSVRAFLADGQTQDRVVVLQTAPDLPELSAAWVKAFITIASNFAVSPALDEAIPRRIWFVWDEFPQAGKVEKFQQILEVGRSRGICAILGVQDLHQLQHLYGADAAKTWQSSIGTKIICRMEASSSADLVRNEIIGKRVVSWTSKSVSFGAWTGGNRTTSKQTHHEEVDVVSSAWLETELGWTNHWPTPTIRALVVGVGRGHDQGVLRAEWIIEAWPTLRPATVPADWTKT